MLVKESASGGGIRPISGSEVRRVRRQVEADGGLMMPLPEEGPELDQQVGRGNQVCKEGYGRAG